MERDARGARLTEGLAYGCAQIETAIAQGIAAPATPSVRKAARCRLDWKAGGFVPKTSEVDIRKLVLVPAQYEKY